jgi:hypothetical protein
MVYDHPELVRKLRWYDRYAIFAFKNGTRGGLLLLPSMLVLAPAILLSQLTNRSEASKAFLWLSLAIAAILALFLFARGIHIYRMEFQHERHVRAFWRRKWAEGGSKMWLLMGLQLAIILGFLAVAAFFIRWK